MGMVIMIGKPELVTIEAQKKDYERDNFSHFSQVREWSTRTKTETNYICMIFRSFTKMRLVLGNTLDLCVCVCVCLSL